MGTGGRENFNLQGPVRAASVGNGPGFAKELGWEKGAKAFQRQKLHEWVVDCGSRDGHISHPTHSSYHVPVASLPWRTVCASVGSRAPVSFRDPVQNEHSGPCSTRIKNS